MRCKYQNEILFKAYCITKVSSKYSHVILKRNWLIKLLLPLVLVNNAVISKKGSKKCGGKELSVKK